MRKFKKGDHVVCVDDYEADEDLVLNNIYTVDCYDDDYVNLLEVDGNWFDDRFELVSFDIGL